MSITNIETFYDRSYNRKVTKLTNSSNNGYFIYPGLNGKITVFKVNNNFLVGKLATANFNDSYHGKPDMHFFHTGSYSTQEIQRVMYDALMRSVKYTTEPLEKEDILYLVYSNPSMKNLYCDIQNWSWNNTDTLRY